MAAATALAAALAATAATELFDHRLAFLIRKFAIAVLVESLHELGSLFFTRAHSTPTTAATTAAATLGGQRFLLFRCQQRLELLDVTFIDSTSFVHAFAVGILFISIPATIPTAAPRHAAGEVAGHDGNHSRSLTDLLVTLGLSKNAHQQHVLGSKFGHERPVKRHDCFEHIGIEIFDFHRGRE